MLDKRTGALLEKINELCGEGGFILAEEGELLSCFSPSDGVDAEELKRILRYLGDRRMIEMKYAEDGVYCVCPLPEGRGYLERVREGRREDARRRRDALLLSGLGALIGSFLGSMLVLLIAIGSAAL